MLTLPLVATFLSTSPLAIGAPQFPLTFDGEMCDDQTGLCSPIQFVLESNGDALEAVNGWEGTYTYNKVSRKFKAPLQDWYSHLFQGYKDPNRACVDGEWATILPGSYGTFWFCLTP